MSNSEITLKDVMETMIHHHEIANKRFDGLENRLEKVETEVVGLKTEVKELATIIDQVHRSGTEESAALNNDILEVKRFVGMPLPALE
ncbi:MAG: hypothetical protein AAGA30_02065 [Planctomycetota bacterium]